MEKERRELGIREKIEFGDVVLRPPWQLGLNMKKLKEKNVKKLTLQKMKFEKNQILKQPAATSSSSSKSAAGLYFSDSAKNQQQHQPKNRNWSNKRMLLPFELYDSKSGKKKWIGVKGIFKPDNNNDFD